MRCAIARGPVSPDTSLPCSTISRACHTEALWLHALNRQQYPRFFRGRYRLGMSLEMIANHEFRLWDKEDWGLLRESLHILDHCRVTSDAEASCGDFPAESAAGQAKAETADGGDE